MFGAGYPGTGVVEGGPWCGLGERRGRNVGPGEERSKWKTEAASFRTSAQLALCCALDLRRLGIPQLCQRG